MRVVPVPLLRDNYAYIVVAGDGRSVAVVDPSEAPGVLDALADLSLEPTQLWLTHHHWDHVGGIAVMVDRFPGCKVIGSAYDKQHQRIPHQTDEVDDTDDFAFGEHRARVLAIPGHTLGAVAYWVEDEIFTGDTLFLAGCGRMFEGTPDMMAASLLKLRGLPPATRIWCGHEYTRKNLSFAKRVEPDNLAIDARIAKVGASEEPTVPWTLAQDREVNPFLRFDLPSLAKGTSPVESFARLRRLKDAF